MRIVCYMNSILKSLCNYSNLELPTSVEESVELLLSPENRPLLTTIEASALEFISKCRKAGAYPTEQYLKQSLPECSFEMGQVLNPNDIAIHTQKLIEARSRQYVSRRLVEIANKVSTTGITDELYEQMESLYNIGKADEVVESITSVDKLAELYSSKESKPQGMMMGSKPLDDACGGLTQGTLNAIFAYVASFKTTWALNILYRATYKDGLNMCLISLEVSKEDVIWNLICRHSFEKQFAKYQYVPHEKMRKNKLTPEEREYVFGTVYPDLINNSKGKLFILDETDFKTMSKAEIRQKLIQIDDECKDTGGLYGFCVDHVGLLKYTGQSSLSESEAINDYVSYFRKMCIGFRKIKGSKEYSKLCGLILVQANREGWKRACKNNGRYDMRAISEANEVERACYRIFSAFSTEALKDSKELLVQCHKNRSGATVLDPQTVFADGAAYVVGDEIVGTTTVSSAELDSLFADGALDLLL